MFDVLEHLEDDSKCLEVIRTRLLNDGGSLVLTVPAYMWLWSNHDLSHDHLRRYSRSGLIKLLKEAGYKNVRISYFFTLLFPLGMIERALGKIFHLNAGMKLPNRVINFIFGCVCGLEVWLIKFINLSYGMSLIVIAER